MLMIRRAASSLAGKWMWASLVIAWRILSSMVPVTSPPMVWASGMFIYAALTAVAIVSKRSPTLITTSGLSMSKMVGSSNRPNPVDLAIVSGVSPSTIMLTRASAWKPSASMTFTTAPKRSSSAEAPTMSCSFRAGCASTACITLLMLL